MTDNTTHTHKNQGSMPWQLQEVEALTIDLKHNPDVSVNEKVCRELEVLERWSDHYHRDLVTAAAFSETSRILLANLHDRLKQMLDASHRSEASMSADKEQELVNVLHRIERILNFTPVFN